MPDPDPKTALREYLVGTCQSIQEAADAYGIPFDEAEQIVADSDIECCESCSWWCEQSEIDEDGNCEDCHTSGDDEEDEKDD